MKIADLGSCIGDIARALFGSENPEHSTRATLRFGRNGAIAVEIDGKEAGSYFNHELKRGGGALQMLAFEGGMVNSHALDWLRDKLAIEIEPERASKSLTARIEGAYDYRDERSELLFQVVRLADPKDFRQRRPAERGWTWKVKGVRIVPYRLTELVKVTSDATIYIVEGEKDADNLAGVGLVSTCNPGGAGKWRNSFAEFFANRDVVILPDNDDAGRAHAEAVASNIVTAAKRVRVLALPGLPEKGDVSDWLAAGGTREQLERLADAAPDFHQMRRGSAYLSEAERGPIIDTAAPYAVAKLYLKLECTEAERPTLHHHKAAFYRWTGTAYSETTDQALRATLYAFLSRCREEDPKGNLQEVRPASAMVSNHVDALRAAAHLDDAVTVPAWLDHVPDLPANEIVACANGLLHLPSLSLIPHTPEFFNLNALDFGFERAAPEPAAWLAFLNQLWPGDRDSIETLQEIFGLCLTGDTSRQKAFLVVGPKRSGKGTIARVLTRLIGADNAVAPTLAALGTNFGLAPLLGKRVAIISDARLGGRADQQAIAERLLSISGEDALTVDRKFRDAWTGRLQTRFLILSNELPRLADASGALASRFIVLVLTNSFYGREDQGLTDRLLAELPGILNWSIAGWCRLSERGYFQQPASAGDAVRQLEDLGSPIGAFLRERCEIGAGFVASPDDLFTTWCSWCQTQGRKEPGNKQSFGRDLRAALPALKTSRPRTDEGRERLYEGIRIKEIPVAVPRAGLDLNDPETPLWKDPGPQWSADHTIAGNFETEIKTETPEQWWQR
jgi:putative DNA primase/helicase